jgi:peptidoglycan hydrolase-like protein with peptidoglycan-binding domain
LGDDVRKIQERLKSKGCYGGPVDGDFGNGTEAAVKAFQRSRGLEADGKKYPTALYNLDAVISVGYRVISKRGTQFRLWATSVLRRPICSIS